MTRNEIEAELGRNAVHGARDDVTLKQLEVLALGEIASQLCLLNEQLGALMERIPHKGYFFKVFQP